MKAHIASSIHGFSLITLGGWGFFDGRSITALIPVFLGVVLLVLNQGIHAENKAQVRIALVLTFIVLIALLKPLTAAIERAEMIPILRISLMVFTSVLAVIAFAKSFKEAKKSRVNR